ncbi:MAG: hypothetical protein LLF98_02765 [Clostridium sp.]|uniref:hypothetical protein n=1 Tax=Clostridium sp. TaxID=1506 RepID=UPI0025B980E2|nr:hypothetical protein [Clostridium sp.]MCE5220206.1 hypothetical protein [Clostridium sp.]
MIEKINNTYKIVCDSCGEIFSDNFYTFPDAVDYKKNNAWRSVKVSEGNWNEICPDCVEFEKRLKGKGNINV